MVKTFYFKKRKTILAIIFFSMINFASIYMIFDPELFIRNFLMRSQHIQYIGYLAFLYSLLMVYSFFILLFLRHEALIVRGNCLVDYTRYESLGTIYFDEIHEVKKKGKHSIEVTLKTSLGNRRGISALKRVVFCANNWNWQMNRFVINDAMLTNEIDEVFMAIVGAMRKKKNDA